MARVEVQCGLWEEFLSIREDEPDPIIYELSEGVPVKIETPLAEFNGIRRDSNIYVIWGGLKGISVKKPGGEEISTLDYVDLGEEGQRAVIITREGFNEEVRLKLIDPEDEAGIGAKLDSLKPGLAAEIKLNPRD